MTALAKAGESEVAQHLATVAARLFATRGYDATSVRTIVEAAGVTKPTLYYYYGSKEGLAQALITRPMLALIDSLRAIVTGPGDLVGKLEAAIEAHFDFCRQDPDRARLVYALYFGPMASGLAAEMVRLGEALHDVLTELGTRLAGTGVIDPSRGPACVAAVRGLIVIHSIDYLYREVELGPDLAHRLVIDLLDGFSVVEQGRRGGR